MPFTLEQLAEQALQLPAQSRADLADKLVESLSEADLGDIQRRWTVEALRRREEVRSGKVQPIDGRQVGEEIRQAIRR